MIKAFIFDLDGTLIDSEIAAAQAAQIVFRQKNISIDLEQAVDLVYGRSWPDICTEITRRFPSVFDSPEQIDKLLHEKFVILKNNGDMKIKNSIELLKQLSHNYPVCIVSGSPGKDVEAAITLMGIESDLVFYLGCEDYTHGKPDPAGFLLAAEKLHLPPNQCLVFEDSAAGIKAAKRAGMYCVALSKTDAPKQDTSLADQTLQDLSEFRLDMWMH